MVQFSEVAGGQVEVPAPVSYLQPHQASLEQVPHIHPALSAPSMPLNPSPVFPHPASLPLLPGQTEFQIHSDPRYSLPQSPAELPSQCSPHEGNTPSTFSAFGSLTSMPSTRLDACTTDMSEIPRSCTDPAAGEVSRVFEVIAVLDEESSLAHTDNMGKNTLWSQQTNIVDNGLQKDIRSDSIDSLVDSKGYASDSSSDVYMNSDYTDTVTSADSGAFLLEHSTYDCKADEYPAQDTPTDASTTEPVAPFYKNEAFTDEPSKELITWSSDEALEVQEEQKEEKHEMSWKVEEPSKELITWSSDEALEVSQEKKEEQCKVSWKVSVPEEDSGSAADREDGDEDHITEEQSGLQSLVQQLVEQHPSTVVDINVEVLDGPVYETLTEALPTDSWLQSTESLHLYKLLKQGRSSSNSLRVQVLTSLKSNTMNNLHERSSFLNLTAASVSNLANACQKALSYVRTDMEFGSMMSLRNTEFEMPPPGEQPPKDSDCLRSGLLKKGGEPTVSSGRHMRNVLYMALLVTVLLVSVNATRNLQSSLNQEGGVGIMGLATLFVSFMLGSLLSPVLVQTWGVKRCVVAGLLLQLGYMAANLYPVLYVLLPASFGSGASMAVIWNAMSTYIVLLARGEADYHQKSYERVSDKFFGIFCLMYQSNLVIGNLIASLVLTFGGGDEASSVLLPGNVSNHAAINQTTQELVIANASYVGELASQVVGQGLAENIFPTNMTSAVFDASEESHFHLCGSEFCHHFDIRREDSGVPARTLYLLFGIFMLLVLAAILIAVFLLEPLAPHVTAASRGARPWHSVKRQFIALLKFCRNLKFLLLLPLLLFSSMQFSFICSEVMMAFVTCPVGVWLVGYSMMAYGVCCSFSSYVTQALVARTGRTFFIGLVLEQFKVLV